MGVTSQIVENPANRLPFRLAQGGDEKDDWHLSRLYGAKSQEPRL
jgi:hypothetical protein